LLIDKDDFERYIVCKAAAANEGIKVMRCLNRVLVDSIVKAGTTGGLTLHNNTNGTVTTVLDQTFITNATNTLDSCIMPVRR